MEIGFRQVEFSCLRASVNEVCSCEQTLELRLMDGMPDVGRVLCAWGQPILRGKEWRSDCLMVSGGMLMWVLYAPEDGSAPRVVDGWLPFQLRFPLPQESREGTIQVSLLPRFADARSLSPRKLLLRAGIGVLAQSWVPESLSRWEAPESIPHVQLLRTRHTLRLPREAGEKSFSIDETLPGQRMEQLLYYSLSPEILEQKVVAGKLVFRGNGNLHLVGMDKEGHITVQDHPLPFSQFSELAGSYEDAGGRILCAVSNLELEPQEQGLRVRCTIETQYLIDQPTTLEVVADAYAPGRELSMQTAALEAPAIREHRLETAGAEVAVQLERCQPQDIRFLPDFPRQYRENGGVSLEIPGTIQLLCQDDEGTLRCISSRWEGKLRLDVQENADLTALPMKPPAPQLGMNGGQTTLRAELPLSLTVTGGQSIPMVTALELGEPRPAEPQRPSLILRRVGMDSLWELAKKTDSSVEAIRSANGLTETPKPDRMLLIPVQS